MRDLTQRHDAAWHREQAQRLAGAAESSNDSAATLALGLASVHCQIAGLPRRAWRTRRQHGTGAPANRTGWPIRGDEK
jgi:hypothetical protein